MIEKIIIDKLNKLDKFSNLTKIDPRIFLAKYKYKNNSNIDQNEQNGQPNDKFVIIKSHHFNDMYRSNNNNEYQILKYLHNKYHHRKDNNIKTDSHINNIVKLYEAIPFDINVDGEDNTMIIDKKTKVILCLEYLNLSLENEKMMSQSMILHLIKYIMYDVLKALQFCHANNIIHRDVKADNILFIKDPIKLLNDILKYEENKRKLRSKDLNLTEEKEIIEIIRLPSLIKLIDFEMSTFNNRKHLTIQGTTGLLAPEYLLLFDEYHHDSKDSIKIDSKIDIWSFGVTFLSFLSLFYNEIDNKDDVNNKNEKNDTNEKFNKFKRDDHSLDGFSFLNADRNLDDPKSELKYIFQTFGFPTEEWKYFYDSKCYRNYFVHREHGFTFIDDLKKHLATNILGKSNLKNELKEDFDKLVDLFSHLLSYDPNKRYSANDALNHIYFADI